MKFCQAYHCYAEATCHGTLCGRHWSMASAAAMLRANDREQMDRICRTEKTRRAYVAALDDLVADVNRQLTPPNATRGGEGA